MQQHTATDAEIEIMVTAHNLSSEHLAEFITTYLNHCRARGMTRPVASSACVHALLTAIFKVSVASTGAPLDLLKTHADELESVVVQANQSVAEFVDAYIQYLRSSVGNSN